MIIDFMGSEWFGTTDGMIASIGYLGISGGLPTWSVSVDHSQCGATTQPQTSTCPPGPFTFEIPDMTPLCCLTYPVGTIVAGGGIPNSTSGIIELANCDVCPSPNTAPNFSQGPVRYASGEIQLASHDLSVRGFGMPWGQSRHFASRQSLSETMGGGYNWQSPQASFVTVVKSTLLATNGQILTVTSQGSGTAQCVRFIRDPSTNTYSNNVHSVTTLASNAGTNSFGTAHTDGSTQSFSGINGGFLQKTAANGATASVTQVHSNGMYPVTVERVATANGQALKEHFTHSYESPSGDPVIATTTISRQVGAGNPWTSSQQVSYSYYGYQEPNGMDEDLKTATTQFTTDGFNWQNEGTTYYRYYNSTSSSSSSSSSSGSGDLAPFGPLAHLPKFVLGPAAFDRLSADPSVTNPFTASDATVSLYADFYFEYDNNRRVTKEILNSGSQTYLFSYSTNAGGVGYNNWNYKTIETLPDGSQNIVYCNYYGLTMLFVHQSGTNQWIDFFKYDSVGNVIWHAHPSAVTGYSESYPDLLNGSSGTYQYLNSTGLIDVYTYYYPSNDLASESVQQGQSGSPIPVRTLVYTSCGSSGSSSSSSSGGSNVNCATCPRFISQETLYTSATDPTQTLITNYAYTFYPGTCAIQLRTTTLPAVTTGQNGSGVSAVLLDYFDQYGNLIWSMDERGFITGMTYDVATASVTQRIDDYNTSGGAAPAGWTTPSGGGLNLVTDITVDYRGRATQTLDPSHTVDINGTATTVRTATWNYYDDANHVTYTAQGYATGSSPSYTFKLVNPVSITITDADGVVQQQIQAASTTTSGSLPAIISAAGGGAAAFPQSTYVRWTTMQYTDCCLLMSRRVYKLIPASGTGTSGVNYDETDFSYDVMQRQVRTATPGGTIAWSVFDVQGRLTTSFIGTNDAGATFSDPTGGGTPGNNMVLITSNVYDGGSAGRDGNLTQVTQQVDVSTTRVTSMTYDFRDRLITTQGPVNYFEMTYYDNLDRVIQSDRNDTTASGHLIGRNKTLFDNRGNVYQTIVYAVDPSSGTVGNALTDNNWYDASQNLIKSFPAGSQLFTKTTYDSLGRSTVQYSAYGPDSTYTDASSVANNTVMEQAELTYDADSNAIQLTIRQRYHNAAATQLGGLQTPSMTPNARVTYIAQYPDVIGRPVNTANFGTNGGTSLSRPSTAPARSDSVLVNSVSYDTAGKPLTTTDPAGLVTLFGYDGAGRTVMVTENYVTGISSSSSSSSSGVGTCSASDDTNRVTQFTFTPDGLRATLVAVNLRTANQTTTYTYGTTLTESNIATSILLRYIDYPNSTGGPGGSDSVAMTYNRQGQRTSVKDQRGCLHSYVYDLLGRLTNDCVTTLGTGVDSTVLQLAASYEVRGMVSELTSYNSATPGSGTIVNDVVLTYHSFGQLVTDAQAHGGAVGGSTPKVQYAYLNGSTNMIRPTTLTYPNGRAVTIGYGTSGGINDSTSQVDNLTDSSGTMVSYAYLGLGTAAQTTYPLISAQYTLLGSSSGTSPAGDIYWGLDLFGRIIDSRWFYTSSNGDIDRIQYGYDRASNRIWRQNPVATAVGAEYDEYYNNDGLQRLKNMTRGTLNSSDTGITLPTFEQCWTLDPTGNWRGFNESNNGTSWTLNQTRTANTVNQITAITTSNGTAWATPAYDAAGNMTSIPQPNSMSSNDTATYDAWNRLISLSGPSGAIQQNQYDARNFRTIRVTPSASETRHFYYTKDWRCIEERIGTLTTADRQFVWGARYIDDLVLRDLSSQRLYALQDANWNVTSIMDSSGTVQERYAYTAYGNPTFLSSSFATQSSSGFGWETLYCGYRYDSSSGLFVVRFRVYQPVLGNWCQEDPTGYLDSMNLFENCKSSPLGSVDPFGLNNTFTNAYIGITGSLTELAYYVRDVGAIGTEAATTAMTNWGWISSPYHFDEWSQAGRSNPAWSPDFNQVVRDRAGNAFMAGFTLGGSEVASAVDYYLETEDIGGAQQRLFAIAGSNAFAAASLRFNQIVRSPEYLPAQGYQWNIPRNSTKNFSIALTEAEAIALAQQEAYVFANKLRTLGRGKELPPYISVTVARNTGRVYRTVPRGNKASRQPTAIAPSLRARMPAKSLADWRITNCSEFLGQNNALLDGGSTLYQMTLDPHPNAGPLPAAPCANCKITSQGVIWLNR